MRPRQGARRSRDRFVRDVSFSTLEQMRSAESVCCVFGKKVHMLHLKVVLQMWFQCDPEADVHTGLQMEGVCNQGRKRR